MVLKVGKWSHRGYSNVISQDEMAGSRPKDCCCYNLSFFRCLPGKQGGFTSGTFRTIVIANNVRLMSKVGLDNT